MGIKIVSLRVDEERLIGSLQQLSADLKGTDEVILDFSPVRRIDRAALDALTEFVDVADDKTVNVVLSGINVDVYRVLKLARLTQRFSMVS
jgi:anti-anti-sigma regulatory factor